MTSCVSEERLKLVVVVRNVCFVALSLAELVWR